MGDGSGRSIAVPAARAAAKRPPRKRPPGQGEALFDVSGLEYEGDRVRCPRCGKLRGYLLVLEPYGRTACGSCIEHGRRGSRRGSRNLGGLAPDRATALAPRRAA